MVHFPLDTSPYLVDLFMGWIFTPLRQFQRNPPSSSNLFEVPEIIQFDASLKKLRENWVKECRSRQPSFLKAILKLIFNEVLVAWLGLSIGNFLILFQAVFISLMISYLQSPNQGPYEGPALAVIFILSSILGCVLRHNSSLKTQLITGKIKNLVAIMISDKILTLNNACVTEESTRGKIMNVVSSDMEILEFTVLAVYFLSSPLLIISAIIIIIVGFGPAGLVGIAISLLHISAIMYYGRRNMKIRLHSNKIGDTRVKMIQNLIEGIKIMKLYAWEIPFLKSIFSVRKAEVDILSSATKNNALVGMLNFSGLALVIFSSLCTKIGMGDEITSADVFMAITVFSFIQMNVMVMCNIGVNTIFAFMGVMKRIGEILLLKEHNPIAVECPIQYSISVNHAVFSWHESQTTKESEYLVTNPNSSNTKQKNCLQEITLNIRPGELVALIGPVGCGKTSLLMGLLGELHSVQGELGIQGSIAFASEEPWILARSIKDNILMGRLFDPDLYNSAIHACDLSKDLSVLANGDETLLGDRGFTLSGGQRARLCLARVVYSNADIVLLDDPLSAVDSEVSNHLFHECIRGALRGKTVILATHQVHCISGVDKILVLENGDKVFFGTYPELKDREDIMHALGDFAFRGEKLAENNIKVDSNQQDTVNKLIIEEEEITDEAAAFKSYLRYIRFGYKTLWLLLIVLIAMAINQSVYVVGVYWISSWSKQSDSANAYYIYGYMIIIVILYATSALRTYPFMIKFLDCNVELHNSALKSLIFTSSAYFDKNPTGLIINRFSKDIGVVDGPLQHYLYDTVSVTLYAFGSIIPSLIILPLNLSILPVTIAGMCLLIKYTAPIIIKLRKIEMASRGPLLTTLISALNGLPTLRCLGLKELFKADFYSHATSHLRAYITFHVFIRFIQLYSELLSNTIIALNVCLIMLIPGYVSPELAAYSLSSSTILLGISSTWSKDIVELSCNMSSTQRLLEYTDLLPEEISEGSLDFKITHGKLKFDDVVMRYRPSLDPALAGFSCEIEAGSKVGIIGRTGAGKSSILQVLFRLVNPESGTIFIDGQDYMSAGLQQIREQMSVIPQSAVIFAASLRENLDPFHRHTDEEIFNALDEVKLKKQLLSMVMD